MQPWLPGNDAYASWLKELRDRDLGKLIDFPWERFADAMAALKLCSGRPLEEDQAQLIADATERVLVDTFCESCGTAFPELAASSAVRDAANRLLLMLAQHILKNSSAASSRRGAQNWIQYVDRRNSNSIIVRVTGVSFLYVFLHGERLHACPIEKTKVDTGSATSHSPPLRLTTAVAGFWSTILSYFFVVLGSYYSYLYLKVYTFFPGSTPKLR